MKVGSRIARAAMLVFAAFLPFFTLADESPAARESIDPATVLAYQGDVQLTQQEIDAAFSKLGENERLIFIRDGGKVDQLIRVLLTRKTLAAEAAKAGYDKEPLIASRMQLESEKELAEAWLQKVVAEAPPADFEALAHEHYLAHPEEYATPEVLDVSHILIGTESRTPDEARELAMSLRDELRKDRSRFDAMVAEYSDDPAKSENHGRYPTMQHGMMVAPFETAAFGLTKDGAISEPVKTDYGYHIIRLNGRSGGEPRKYDEIKEEAVALAEKRYYQNYRDNYLRRVLSQPMVVPPEAVEIMAKRHFGENFELAPNLRR